MTEAHEDPEVHFPKCAAESARFHELETYLQGRGLEFYDVDVFRYTPPRWAP